MKDVTPFRDACLKIEKELLAFTDLTPEAITDFSIQKYLEKYTKN